MSGPALRICDIRAGAVAAEQLTGLKDLGFSHLLGEPVAAGGTVYRWLAEVNLTELPLGDPLVAAHPEWFSVRLAAADGALDPRHLDDPKGTAVVRGQFAGPAFEQRCAEMLGQLLKRGAAGFFLRYPHRLPPSALRGIRDNHRDRVLVADTVGLTREEAASLAGFGFDGCTSSLAWWDFRAPWLVEEYRAFSRIAPVLATAAAPGRPAPVERHAVNGVLAAAAVAGDGAIVPIELVQAQPAAAKALNRALATARKGNVRSLTGPGAAMTVVLREGADHALVALINPDPAHAVDVGEGVSGLLGAWALDERGCIAGGSGHRLLPREARLYRATRRAPIRTRRTSDAAAAAQNARIVVENIVPSVDGGRFAVKRTVGERVMVEADVYTDGHPLLAAVLLVRPADAEQWAELPFALTVNDRWIGELSLDRVGDYECAIEAWIDRYGGFVRDLTKKRDAGVVTGADLADGLALIREAAEDTRCALRDPLEKIIAAFRSLPDAEKARLLLAPETADAMRRIDKRPGAVRSAPFRFTADRKRATFGSWYELFPRSQSGDPKRHGTFRDVIARLPMIAEMGFDVLYMPPIHPIGTTNRKGRNNALKAGPDDPGSVYAIGSPEGGHDAILPELGTFEDFKGLIEAANAEGIELALDFAVQCSPDHPWLKEHPGWFDWRADGSLKFAENPPKKYEDIVNVDFYAKDAVPGLWLALRDVVRFWIGHGVRIFRVDNPHTKPFAFWEWLIGDIRAQNPEVIFLAEAFTRPKIMYRLAKLGFTQSYTYFTWRNTKAELTEYLTELSTAPAKDIFRPNFFVNTPDINPIPLQTSGRAGFLIRACLAATLSGSWGLFQGFELCEAAPLPGREEYADSDKYEIRVRNFDAPGNIRFEIAQLNRLRRAEPALQTHLGITFYNAFNPNVLYFGKKSPNENTRILVAVSLNPHGVEEASFEAPTWEWGLPDSGVLNATDLLTDQRLTWYGKMQQVRLTPDAPYRIWRVEPQRSV